MTAYGGNISIYSERGYIALNGMRFPTYVNNTVGISQQDYILKYKWIGAEPYAVWEAPVTASVTNLFSTGTVSITGSPVVLNGLPINFTDSLETPVELGGIPAGSTFSNVPVTEMIRQLLYPYILPVLSTSLNRTYWEIGDLNTLQLELSFTVYRNATFSMNTIDYKLDGISTSPVSYINPFATPLVPANVPIRNLTVYKVVPPLDTTSITANTVSHVQFDYNISMSDTYPSYISSTSSLKVVIPWYYGTTTYSATSSVGLNNINTLLGTSSIPSLGKLTPLFTDPVLSVTSSYNKSLQLSTAGLVSTLPNQGYIYFGYPSDFPDLQSIQDPNGFTMTPSFKKFDVTLVQSPNGYWFNKEYKFYIFVGSATGSSTPLATTIGSAPTFDGFFKFNFA